MIVFEGFEFCIVQNYNESMRINKHLKIHGRVQGVGFRYFTVQQAKRLSLTGWVANKPDGTVETLLQGNRSDVDEMIARLRRGPIAANVTDIEEVEEPGYPDERFDTFSVRR